MENNKIPKIIHYCWFGPGEMSQEEKNYIESWKKNCPDYELRLWSDSNYDISKCQYTREAAENGKWSFVTDYVRLDVLYQYGGLYFDTDVELLKNFDSFLTCEAFIGFEDGEHVNSGQAMGTVPGNPLIKELRDMYHNISFYKEDGSLNLKECPRYLTEYLETKGLKGNDEKQCIEGMVVFPTRYFCPKSFQTGKIHITDDTVSIHHFRGAWHSEKERKIILWMQKVRRVLGVKRGNSFLQWFFETKDKIRHKKG